MYSLIYVGEWQQSICTRYHIYIYVYIYITLVKSKVLLGETHSVWYAKVFFKKDFQNSYIYYNQNIFFSKIWESPGPGISQVLCPPENAAGHRSRSPVAVSRTKLQRSLRKAQRCFPSAPGLGMIFSETVVEVQYDWLIIRTNYDSPTVVIFLPKLVFYPQAYEMKPQKFRGLNGLNIKRMAWPTGWWISLCFFMVRAGAR